MSGKPMSERHKRVSEDNNKCEESRMISSGVATRSVEYDEGEMMEEVRVHVVAVKEIPPFLKNSDVEYGRQQEFVEPVKNKQSDLATLAKKGSETMRLMRNEKERRDATRDALGMGKLDDQVLAEQPQPAEDAKKSLADVRKTLPIYRSKDELVKTILHNRVTIVVGETGSGKTTQLTQYLLEAGFGGDVNNPQRDNRIGCTQPRRVAAMSVAKRVSEEVGCKLGDTVGYAIRFEDVTSQRTIVKYMTDGVLLRETLKSGDLESYSVIVMDEAHERSLNTDVLLGILKKVLKVRQDLRLVVTSATMDAEKFANFFGNAPVFYIKGKMYPVEIHYSKSACLDYVKGAVDQCIQIHISQLEGDILVFMTGQEDIEATCYAIRKKLADLDTPELRETMVVLPIYSLLPQEQQELIFKTFPGKRKVVIATNIAETSLTLDGICFVIDCGFCKFKVFNPRIGMDALQVYPESQAAANQRAGRAGRTRPGKCFRLFTEQHYLTEMLANTMPEMQRTNLGNVVLLLKSLNVKDIFQFDFMDPPPKSNIQQSMLQLWMLGALNDDGDLTDVGSIMIEFPLDPSLSKTLHYSTLHGCSEEVVVVLSMLSVPQIFLRPNQREDEADKQREKFFVHESDHLTYLNVYKQFLMNRKSAQWCSENFINYKGMIKVIEIVGQLSDILRDLKLKQDSCGDDWDVVRKVLCSGLFHNTARRKGVGEYITMLSGVPCFLHQSSALSGMGQVPDYVVYHELMLTTKEYMHTVTSVDPYWLKEVAPRFFRIKEHNTAPRSSVLFRADTGATSAGATPSNRTPSHPSTSLSTPVADGSSSWLKRPASSVSTVETVGKSPWLKRPKTPRYI